MTPTDFSVLLLAWDDADPAVVVLGGSALPPTLPLVYQLAAHHPVLAVYPHLPAGEADAATAAAAPAWPAPGVIPSPLEADANGPGVRLLPANEPNNPRREPAPAAGSRLVGLDDLLPAIQGALPTSHSLSLAPGAAPRLVPGMRGPVAAAMPAAPARSQWPARSGPPLAGAGQAPAAPYVGAAEAAPVSSQLPSYATARASFPAPPPAPPRPAATARPPAAASAAAETPATPATPATGTAPLVPGALAAVPAPALSPAPTVPGLFDEPVAEIGAAEASDLDAPENDLLPDAAPLAAAKVAAEATAPAAALTWAVRQPTLEGLNFRMIQYARQAAQLVDGRQDFGVIYAPGWPAWLAALEIRNRSGRPLVLYAAALASDTAPAAERGWLLGLERMVLRRATLVLVPDAEALTQLHARHADALGEVRIVAADDEVAVQLVLAEVALA